LGNTILLIYEENMASLTSKGMKKGAFEKLRRIYPYARPKTEDSIEKIQRRQGWEDVMEYIEENMVDDS